MQGRPRTSLERGVRAVRWPRRIAGVYGRAGGGRGGWPLQAESHFEPGAQGRSGQGFPELAASWVGLEDGVPLVGGVEKREDLDIQAWEPAELGRLVSWGSTWPDPRPQDGKGEVAGELGASQWTEGPATGVCARASAAWREGGQEAGGVGGAGSRN